MMEHDSSLSHLASFQDLGTWPDILWVVLGGTSANSLHFGEGMGNLGSLPTKGIVRMRTVHHCLVTLYRCRQREINDRGNSKFILMCSNRSVDFRMRHLGFILRSYLLCSLVVWTWCCYWSPIQARKQQYCFLGLICRLHE